MPAAAVLTSEDDDAMVPMRAPRSRSRKGGALAKRESGLAAIDITTPLEEHERMPEVKPYVVGGTLQGSKIYLRLPGIRKIWEGGGYLFLLSWFYT